MNILVNATALRAGGALSILKQFVDNIPETSGDTYYVFIDTDVILPSEKCNIRYIYVDTKQWYKRILWDAWGIKKWLKKNSIKPSLMISLQNTGVNLHKGIPQIIYYHQLLPLSNHSWNIMKREEFKLFLYKHFYSFFVTLYKNENTHYIVQIPSTKKAFMEKFNVDENNIHVIPPEVSSIKYDDIDIIPFNDGKIHLIYPATTYVYKNHRVLLEMLRLLKKEDKDIYDNIKLHLTVEESQISFCEKFDEVSDALIFEGTMPFSKLLAYYKSVDMLLFPSYIESFGLPLLEAAGAGLPIIASDLPYVHDVLHGYDGVYYSNYKDSKSWADTIKKVCFEKKKHTPFNYPADRGNWGTFFELVEKLKNNNYVNLQR